MAARLVTGRAVVPHINAPSGLLPAGGDRHPPIFPPLGITPHALALVVEGMNAVVNDPTARPMPPASPTPAWRWAANRAPRRCAASPSTNATTGCANPRKFPWKDRDHALFVGFAPVGAPRYVCAIVVEHGGEEGGGGSAVAAPLVRDILVEAQKRDPAGACLTPTPWRGKARPAAAASGPAGSTRLGLNHDQPVAQSGPPRTDLRRQIARDQVGPDRADHGDACWICHAG